MSLLTRFLNIFRALALEQELDDELRFHLDERVAEYLQQGMNEQEAEASALARFGTLAVIKDQMRGIDMMNRSFIAGLAVGMLAVSIPAGVLWRNHARAPVVAPLTLHVANRATFQWQARGAAKVVKIRCGDEVTFAVNISRSQPLPEIAPPKGCTLMTPTER